MVTSVVAMIGVGANISGIVPGIDPIAFSKAFAAPPLRITVDEATGNLDYGVNLFVRLTNQTKETLSVARPLQEITLNVVWLSDDKPKLSGHTHQLLYGTHIVYTLKRNALVVEFFKLIKPLDLLQCPDGSVYKFHFQYSNKGVISRLPATHFALGSVGITLISPEMELKISGGKWYVSKIPER